MSFSRWILSASLAGLLQIGCTLQQASDDEETTAQASEALERNWNPTLLHQEVPVRYGDWAVSLAGLADTYLIGESIPSGWTTNAFSLNGYASSNIEMSFDAEFQYGCSNISYPRFFRVNLRGNFGSGELWPIPDCALTWSKLKIDYLPLPPGEPVPFGEYITTGNGFNFFTTVSLLGSAVSAVSRSSPITIPSGTAGQPYVLYIRYSNRVGPSGIKVGFQKFSDGSGATLKAVSRVAFPKTSAIGSYKDWRIVKVDFTPTSSWGPTFYVRLQYVDGSDSAIDSAWIARSY